jgi:type I restriction enzyme, S subunit
MAERKTALLDDLVEIIIDHRGKTPLKMGGNFIASGYPVLSAKNVKTDKLIEMDSIRYISGELYSKWMKDELFRNDIILTSEAPLGEVYLIPDDSKYALGQRLFGIRVKKDRVLPQYLSAWLASPQGQAALHSRATGTTAQGIKQSELRKVLIDLPPMPTQELIANTRSAIISKIDLNRQMNAVLESAARALFKSWFVDFDPVRAKMEGRAPDGLSADIAALFPDTLVDSSLGEIPNGWEEKPMDQMIELIGGGTPKTSNPEYWNGDIPWFSVVDTPSETAYFNIWC